MTPGEPAEKLPRATGPGAPGAAPRVPLSTDGDGPRPAAKAPAAKAPAAGGAGAGAGSGGGAGAAGGSAGASARQGASAGGAVAGTSGAQPAAPGKAPARPAAKPAKAAKAPAGRRVRLTLSRIDPWSALKMSFLLSVAMGIAMVVAVAALWMLLKGMGAFDQVNNLIGSIVQDGDKKFDIADYVGFGPVVSLSIVFAVIDVFLITAIATLGSIIYNLSASLVGGLGLTLTDD